MSKGLEGKGKKKIKYFYIINRTSYFNNAHLKKSIFASNRKSDTKVLSISK